MDEGVRCLICIAALWVCCLLQVIITSFKIAIDHINDSDLEDLQQNNPMEAEKLEKYHSDDHLLVISSSFLRIFTGIGIVINSFLLLQDVVIPFLTTPTMTLLFFVYFMPCSFLERCTGSVPKSIVKLHCAI